MIPRAGSRFHRTLFLAAAVGVGAGLLSGLFGVGGGVVIVPALVLLLRFDQRRAVGTSLAAVIPITAAGVAAYASQGWVAWIPGALLAVGAVGGAQLGSMWLARLPQPMLRWIFVAFACASALSLLFIVPSRSMEGTSLTPWLGVGLIALGAATGILSGLLGVGGGVIVVPALMMLFGFSDLLAKGTSLLMILPGAISGTIANARRAHVDGPVTWIVGIGACIGVPFGTWFAKWLDPHTANIILAIFLIVIATHLILSARPTRPR